MTRTVPIAAAFALAGCASAPPPDPIAIPSAPPIVAQARTAAPQVRSTIIAGDDAATTVPAGAPPPKAGTITLTFPDADIRAVTATIATLTRRQIAVDPAATGRISLITPGPVARSAVLGLFEGALRTANLALVAVGEGYVVRPIGAAQAPVQPDATGFGTEIVTLRFVNADEVRKVLDGALPGVVTATDPAAGTITIAGTTGQRASARDMVGQFDVNWLRRMSFALFVPERTDSRLIVPELDKLINAADAPTRGLVRLISMERLNGILAVSAQPQYLDDVRRWIDVLDREGENNEQRIFVYRVQNGRARDLAATLNKALGGGSAGEQRNPDPFAPDDAAPRRDAGQPPAAAPASGSTPAPGAAAPPAAAQPATGGPARVTADEVNNAVVIYGTPRDYAVMEEALRRLDIPPVQVMIEAAITEVTLNDELRYGVQWNYVTGNNSFSGTPTNAIGTPANPLSGFSYFHSGSSIAAALNALEQRTSINVVSAPKLVVLNNQTAALQVGDQVPVSAGNAVSVDNPNAPIVNSIEYRDTGVILKVTPRVNAGGMVLLDVAQEVSDVSDTGGNGRNGAIASPTISTRRVSTSVAVADGQVIALGGLFRDAKTFGRNGLPILSRLPVIGALFGNQTIRNARTELIVLLKPHVVRSIDDGRSITEELRAKLRTLEPFRTRGQIP